MKMCRLLPSSVKRKMWDIAEKVEMKQELARQNERKDAVPLPTLAKAKNNK